MFPRELREQLVSYNFYIFQTRKRRLKNPEKKVKLGLRSTEEPLLGLLMNLLIVKSKPDLV